MKSITPRDNAIGIDDDCLQDEAMDELNRKLTPTELEDVYCRLRENTSGFIRDAITDVVRKRKKVNSL